MTPERFEVAIPEERLDDLRRRLRAVHWAPDFANDDWRYGTNGAYLRALTDYWLNTYNWREQEKEINALEHYRVHVDGIPIHFVRAHGRGPAPMPIILTHGWPWTFWDFRQVIEPLADPAAHGGDPADSFDVVVPSLPGFVFSTPLEKTGINWWRTADLWVALMRMLGYERFAAHGGDWGALVSVQLGHKYEDALIGIHINGAFPLPIFAGDRPWSLGDAAAQLAQDAERRAALARWERKFASHVAVHQLDPQTLAYALHDSPLGLCAWILERRRAWSDCGGEVERRFSKDHLLTTMMLYWLTDSVVTSLRYYYEAAANPWKASHARMPVVAVPTGISLFEPDMAPVSYDWSTDYYHRVLFRVHSSGGHFAPAEEPEVIVQDIRDTFRPLRRSGG